MKSLPGEIHNHISKKNKHKAMKSFIFRSLYGRKSMKIQNFNIFSRKEMRFIRNIIKAEDPEVALLTEVTCPVSGKTEELLIFTIPAFLIPEE